MCNQKGFRHYIVGLPTVLYLKQAQGGKTLVEAKVSFMSNGFPVGFAELVPNPSNQLTVQLLIDRLEVTVNRR